MTCGARVLDLVLELALGVQRVVAHRHRADPLAGEERDHVLGAVRQDHAHAIALLDAEPGKDRREPLDLLEERRVAHVRAEERERRPVGEARHRAAQQRDTATPSGRARASAARRADRRRTRRDHRSWGASSRPLASAASRALPWTLARRDVHRGFASDRVRCDHRRLDVRSSRGGPIMKRKTLLALSALPMALLLSSCFVLQGFWITANVDRYRREARRPSSSSTPTARRSGTRATSSSWSACPTVATCKCREAKWGTNGT